MVSRRRDPNAPVPFGFEGSTLRIPIADIAPLKLIAPPTRKTTKYLQIAASMREVGVIEPPVVARDPGAAGKYLLLDGHVRIEILKDMGKHEVDCLVSIDDEAFTYNKRVNRLAIIQEHKMILKAIERGASDARIAKALNIEVRTLHLKKQLLAGICSEAADLLKDKHVAVKVFSALRKMAALRQIEAAELMIAMNKYTVSYAESLLAATPQAQLVESQKPKVVRGLSSEQMALMERESANLERDFKVAEQAYGVDHLDLVLAKGYLGKLLGNARVVRYLAQHHQDLLSQFQKIADLEPTPA